MSEYSPEQLASIAKERPKNETKKRFVLSGEDFSKERLDAVKEEMDEMKDKYSEVLSLCMFGSMVKGTAHEGSDIDGYLYIDSSIVAENRGVPEEQIIEAYKENGYMDFVAGIDEKYEDEFRDGLKEKTGLEDKDVKHIRNRPISEKVIDIGIQNSLAYERAFAESKKQIKSYPSMVDAWVRARPKRGSHIDEFLKHEKDKPKFPHYPEPTSKGLSNMFHLDVGGGIKKYRSMFIGKLAKLGYEGERVWADTIKSTEMMENNLSTDDTKRYPRTLADAIKVYGADDSEQAHISDEQMIEGLKMGLEDPVTKSLYDRWFDGHEKQADAAGSRENIVRAELCVSRAILYYKAGYLKQALDDLMETSDVVESLKAAQDDSDAQDLSERISHVIQKMRANEPL